ncbi:hypothetical protein AB4Z35_29585 [Pseudomonas sp. KB_15]|uniref:hypothetical protein n=1 Tax=Pseudomonas sp. KB_15 TaxID=3233035 RepID=UPI003F9B15B5
MTVSIPKPPTITGGFGSITAGHNLKSSVFSLMAWNRKRTLPSLFRGKNGSALTRFVNPAKGYFMADSLTFPDFPHGIWKKRRKNRRGFHLPSDSPKTQ